MDERNIRQNTDSQESHSYGNGSTRPPKSHGGLIALVLGAAIFLCSLVSLLGVWQSRDYPSNGSSGAVSFLGSSDGTIVSNPSEPTNISLPIPDYSAMQLKPLPEKVDNIPQDGGLSLQAIYEINIPSVVSVTCTSRTGQSSGTGVVLTQNGYLVTNAHVVDDARQIQVLLTDGRTFTAQLVGADSFSDLAVLYIPAEDLTPAEFGNSEQVRVGDAVAAIGDPLGIELRGTMTDGIISAINRNLLTGGRSMTLLQTNAALNSGNSGGPLINCHGQVIGINTLKIGAFSDSAGVEGLGFAIPSVTVKEVVDQLISQGYVSGRPALPLDGVWVSSYIQQFRDLPAGLYITQPPKSSVIRAQDILMSVDGVRVTDEDALNEVLYSHRVGDEVELVLYRGGVQYSVRIQIVEAGD